MCEPSRGRVGDRLLRYVHMEPAPRSPLEPLAELPVEEPLDADVPPRKPPAAAAGAPAAPTSAGAVEPSEDADEADLNFTDPELFLAPDDPAGAAPAVSLAEAPKPPQAPLTLALEDPIIDELLTTPALAAKPTIRNAPGATLTAARPVASAIPLSRGPSKPPAGEPAAQATRPAAAAAPARVPVAKTPTLAAAAVKLAAATAARSAAPARPPSIPAAPTVPAPRAPAAPAAPPKAVAPQAPRAEAPNLATWASARASAAMTRPAPTPALAPAPASRSPTLKAVASAPAPRATPPSATAPAPAAPAPTTSPPMDRDFIARNQIVERYLSGRLPLKGATDFERLCREHPELLDEIGLPERVNAGLRLLEASGKPEPWQESARPFWQKPQVTLGLAVGVAILGFALVVAWGATVNKDHRIAALEKQAYERALDPATSTREIRLLPSRSGASATPAITIGGANAQLADFKIDESRSPFHSFRVTIDRIDQGRVAVITNLTKDSNGHLRMALNSSALGPGNYQLTIEGIGWRGDPEPDSWITIGITR